MDKVLGYGGVGAIVGGVVVFLASLVGGSSPTHEAVATETPPPRIMEAYTCPSDWKIDYGYAHDTVNPSCQHGDYRVWLNADGGFSHGAKVNKDNIIQGDFIFDAGSVPGWPN